MQRGALAARAVLMQIRDGRQSGPTAAGMIDAAMPDDSRNRMGFLIVIGEYLSTSLQGCALDPENLST